MGIAMTRLKKHYDEVVRAEMKKEFGYKNDFQIPRITKIVLNMGVGEGVQDSRKVESAAKDMTLIGGQKPVISSASKSIAQFK
ncbi:MAG: 50S ribosomal protein L5, partial [Pseudomonadota bacterium]|nr:50S ribosomal protein L5 [Pseudomonadota bacterium]